jgi:sporulation protein YlmC with PRC-barrel domain
VLGADGRPLGRVSAVLFHAAEPRVVGVQIARSPVLGVIDRRDRYALLADLEPCEDDGLRLPYPRLPKDDAGEQTLGFSWSDSVVWRGMPVRSALGEPVGVVHDVLFDAQSGAVTTMRVSTGVVGDAALGRLEVPGELVRGFDSDAVIVLPGYNEINAAGGAARAVAAGVANVKVRGGQVADGALQVGVAAAGALGRSMRSGLGRKALDKLKALMDDEE